MNYILYGVRILLLLGLLSTIFASAPARAADAPNSGLAAQWTFDEGSGDVLRDSSGNNNNGKIHGAHWVAIKNGHALRFDGVDDYVDCGTGPSLDITGPLTLETWVRPDVSPTGEPGLIGKFYESYVLTYYKTGACFFYISGGGNNIFGGINTGQWSHVVGVFDGTMMRMYVNGVETTSQVSKFPKPASGKNFLMGCKFGDPANSDEAMRDTEHYSGMMTGVRVYARALSPKEVIEHYNQRAADLGDKPFDPNKLGHLGAEAYLYPDKKQAVLNVNYHWIQPMPQNAGLRAELSHAGETTVLQSVPLKPEGVHDAVEATFSLADLPNGQYTLRAILMDAAGHEQQRAERTFRWPPAPTEVPAPAQRVAPKLAAPIVPPAYNVEVDKNGGFVVQVKGRVYRVESAYSYPHGGENQLTAAGTATAPGSNPAPGGNPGSNEAGWKVTTRKLGTHQWQVRAEGPSYRLDRTIKQTPTRIEVADTFTNKTNDVLGIILSNHIDTQGVDDANNTLMANPTVFVSEGAGGLGLIALDDIYQLQQNNSYNNGRVALRDENFGLDKGASYTVQWAAYPTATTDYFDFINQVRRDEKINGYVAGNIELTSHWGPPPPDHAAFKDIKYPTVAYLTHVTANPMISIEGWEFMEYPEVQARIKQAIAETKQTYPDMLPMFHVAHALYATNKPKALFPDSLATDANGDISCYGSNSPDYYGGYFSKELVDAGWRWWLFYPTLENSFGKYMLKSADYMIDGLGAKAMWADGFIGGYIRGDYTYDKWDGHSVTIDPATKLVTRKKGNVTYLSMPVLKAVVQKFHDKGGMVISNGLPGPHSMWNLPMMTSNETGGGDQQPISALHLGQTVTPLGNPLAIKSEHDIYLDVLNKLDLGALFFWYGEQDFVTGKSIVTDMYPITFEALHAGTVTGKERIVTKRSGVYGWPGDRSLHFIHAYDARGKLVAHKFLSTVDAASVRSAVELGENEAAVVIKVPLQLKTTRAVNVHIDQYDASGIALRLNGKGSTTLTIANGPFKITPGQTYQISGIAQKSAQAAKDGTLTLRLSLNGPTTIAIGPLAN